MWTVDSEPPLRDIGDTFVEFIVSFDFCIENSCNLISTFKCQHCTREPLDQPPTSSVNVKTANACICCFRCVSLTMPCIGM